MCYSGLGHTLVSRILIPNKILTILQSYIHAAKNILFGCCRETALRLKTYRIDAAKLDCRNIITKMNEIGTDCPCLVAKNISLCQ